MKIAIPFVSVGWSGGERVVYEIVKCMSKIKNTNITIFLNDGLIKYFSDIKNIKIVNLGKLPKNILFQRIALTFIKRKFLSAISQKKYDIFFLNMETPIEIYGSISKKIKSPCLNVFHGTEIVIFGRSYNLIFKLIKEFGFVYAMKYIPYKIFIKPNLIKALSKGLNSSVSHHQLKNIPEKYKKKTIVIPNGVNAEKFKPLKNIKQKNNVILFVGRFIKLKGIKEILKVSKQLPRYEFWFVGQGPLRDKIKGKNVKNLGFQSTEELVKLYNQSTICVFPSYREGMPLCGLEAMACGKSVIATPLGFLEYIENEKDGIIIPAKDEKALKNAIVDLMENPKKRKMIEKNARQKALKYSWNKIVKKYLKVFKEVIGE